MLNLQMIRISTVLGLLTVTLAVEQPNLLNNMQRRLLAHMDLTELAREAATLQLCQLSDSNNSTQKYDLVQVGEQLNYDGSN